MSNTAVNCCRFTFKLSKPPYSPCPHNNRQRFQWACYMYNFGAPYQNLELIKTKLTAVNKQLMRSILKKRRNGLYFLSGKFIISNIKHEVLPLFDKVYAAKEPLITYCQLNKTSGS